MYVSNSWNIDCDPGFYGVFCKTTVIKQLRRWNGLIIEKYEKNGISFMCGCKCVSLYVCARMRVCVIVTYGCVLYHIALGSAHTHKVI